MAKRFSRFLLEKAGWTIIGEAAPEKNCVFLEAPHTSVWDFVVGYLYYNAVGGKLRVMVKKELFFFPLGGILRSLGCIPIDRKSPQKTVLSIVHEMEHTPDGRTFHLAICPEGTRKPIRKWKTGYHTIAQGAGIPVYISMVDWGQKRVGVVGKFNLTDNARQDTDRIQQVYEDLGVVGKHPEKFVTK